MDFINEHNISEEVDQIFKKEKKKIINFSLTNKPEDCMSSVFDLWMFMNRYRNCDLKYYFDEEIHDALKRLNKKKLFPKITKKKTKNFRLAYILTNIVDTGSASVPHRFMMNKKNADLNDIKQFVLVTNLRNRNDQTETEGYRYLKTEIVPEVIDHFQSGLTWVEKYKKIENWVVKNKIDFVIASPCPAAMSALASNPAVVQGILSQDCYCFTLGPGAFDITFYVTNDQVYKYNFKNEDHLENVKITYLPLHSEKFVKEAQKMNRQELDIPVNAIISASTNMWKSSFGDTEFFFDMIKDLILENRNYHHIFAGTSRCLDNLRVYINKYPFLEKNIHFIGEVKNIYSLLKTIDFFINSFPTSGGSDIEAAYVGKPTIEFIHSRNLTLHPTEFLSSRECIVTNKLEFKKLANKLINNVPYRIDLGKYLQKRVKREYNKTTILKECVLDTFIERYRQKLSNYKPNNKANFQETINYEKNISYYNSFIIKNFNLNKKISFLKNLINLYPNKPFAWIKLFELSIINLDQNLFSLLLRDIYKDHKFDGRVLLMISLNFYFFGDYKNSLKFKKKSNFMLKKIKLPEIINNLYKHLHEKTFNKDEKGPHNKFYKSICSSLPLFYDY
jgi:hypothetical protein